MGLFQSIRKKLNKLFDHDLQRELAWIIAYGRRFRGEILLYIGLGMLGSVLGLAGSVLSKHIIDMVTGVESGRVTTILIFYVVMQLTGILITALVSRITARINIKVSQQIRSEVYDKMMRVRWEELSEYHSADLLSRVSTDVTGVASSILGWMPEFCVKLFQFCGTLGLLLFYDPALALLALLSAPVTLILSRMVMNRMRSHNVLMRQLGSQLMVFNEESFQNVHALKAFGLTDQYSAKLRQLQQAHRKAVLDYNAFSVRNTAFLSLVGTVVTLCCFGLSLYRLHSGHITYGTMTLFLQLAASLSAGFSALVAVVPSAIHAATAAGRIMAVVELPEEEKGDTLAAEQFRKAYSSDGVSISAQNLSFSYSGTGDVFSHVDLQADAGQMVALVGPSGEGKTTILRLLLGICQPGTGSLTAHSRDGSASIPISPATRQLFSYVPQGNTMFAGTVAENLRMVLPEATEEQLWEVLRLACADRFVAKLPQGLDTPVREQGGGFSQGQIQRLCIARALLADAPVLLMDEATSALDIATERQVLRNIMAAKRSRTCILTTHRPSVLSICQRVYQVSGGRVTPAETQQIHQLIRDFRELRQEEPDSI